jgi:hypothetical protein
VLDALGNAHFFAGAAPARSAGALAAPH